MNMEKVWMNIRDSFWFLPTVYGMLSLIFVFVINIADAWFIASFKDQIPEQLLTSKDTAKKLYAALVTAILTMTTVSFSVIMVVLTTYSTQFSPRTLQDFMRSRTTQHVLGIYCFGFIFALLLLILVDHGNPVTGPFIMSGIAIICLAFFVYFIHHSARWIQVNNLIAKIRMDGSKIIKHVFKEEKFHEHSFWDEKALYRLSQQSKTIIKAKHSGYVQEIRWNGMVEWAWKHDYVIDLHVQIGSFVPEGFPIMSILTTNQSKVKENGYQFLIVGNERTDIQDAEFAIQKIVEIALRAMSPAINDPHTAINSINRIGALLIEIGANYKEIPYIADRRDKLRIIYQPKKYEDYLYKSFYQIRYYGKDDVSVLYGLLEILYKIALVSDQTIREKIWQFHFYITDVIMWDKLSKLDHNHLKEMYSKLRACCEDREEQ